MGNRLAILRTCRALHNEVEAELYDRRTLQIMVRPELKGWFSPDLPGSTMVDFANTNFAKFKSIRIEIYPPKRGDEGQLLYARASILNLVRALRGSRQGLEDCEPYSRQNNEAQHIFRLRRKSVKSNLRSVEVIFSNSNTVDIWHEDLLGGVVNFFHGSRLLHDIAFMIMPFGHLCAIAHISFSLPADIELCSSLLKIVKTIQRESTELRPSDDRQQFLDRDFIEFEAQQYLGLEKILDTALGPTAALLRRERLIHWQWYKRTTDAQLRMADREARAKYGPLTAERYWGLGRLDPDLTNHSLKLHFGMDPLWLEKWRGYWPDGLPPKGSVKWDALCSYFER